MTCIKANIMIVPIGSLLIFSEGGLYQLLAEFFMFTRVYTTDREHGMTHFEFVFIIPGAVPAFGY